MKIDRWVVLGALVMALFLYGEWKLFQHVDSQYPKEMEEVFRSRRP